MKLIHSLPVIFLIGLIIGIALAHKTSWTNGIPLIGA